MKLSEILSDLNEAVEKYPHLAEAEVAFQHASARGWIPVEEITIALTARRIELRSSEVAS